MRFGGIKRGKPHVGKARAACHKKQRKPGIQALIHATGLEDKAIDTFHVGFILGPCINASGRLDIADTAVELFLTDDPVFADTAALALTELNRQRRQLTEEGTELALEIIENEGLAEDKIIVLYCEELQESVAGIIAGRIKERFYRPTIVLVGKHDVVRGSCRSIEGYNIYEGLNQCRTLLCSFGGHPMAAGLSIPVADIGQFRKRMNENCTLTEDDLQPLFRIDCPLSLTQTNLLLAKKLLQLAPFGKENSQPLFAAKRLCLHRISLLGKEEQVMRLYLRLGDGTAYEAISFSGKERLNSLLESNYGPNIWMELLGGRSNAEIQLDILYSLSVNCFNGRESAQLQVVDFRLAE